MNCFTRTGLIPAISDSSLINNTCLQKTPDPHVNMVVISAPFTFRPFLHDRSYVHPYSSICSIMCNHPILDSSTKKNIAKAKEMLKRGLTAGRGIQQSDCEEDLNIGNQEDIFVPEILFRRYTQTDSRPQTPSITTPLVSRRTSSLRTRRCITPDDQHLSNAPDRTRLVLDLRKCLSHSSLAEGKCVEVLKEDSVVITTIISTNVDGANIRRKKPALLSSEITKHRYFSRKSFKTESKNDIPFKKNAPYILPAEASPKKENKSKKQKEKKKAETKKSRKLRKKDLNQEVQNFNENLETEIALSADNKDKLSENNDNEEKSNGNETNCSELRSINSEYVQTLLRTIDLDILENDFHADKYNRFLKECGLSARHRQHIDFKALQERYELEISGEKLSQRSYSIISSNQHQEIPFPTSEFCRIITRRNARFELPLDKTELEDTRPLEYLKRHVQVSEVCRSVYNRIFRIYATTAKNHQEPLDSESIFYITTKKSLKDALQCAMGERFWNEERDNFCKLLSITEDGTLRIDVRTWHGICALCERIYGDQLTLKSISTIEDSCHEIEKADFEFLDQKLSSLAVSDELRKMLSLIKDS